MGDEMARPVTHTLLASAIEYAAQAKLTATEHQRFFVTHYDDPVMEEARQEYLRIVISGERYPLSPSRILSLHAVAKMLRET
jgi:hypothetical protein